MDAMDHLVAVLARIPPEYVTWPSHAPEVIEAAHRFVGNDADAIRAGALEAAARERRTP